MIRNIENALREMFNHAQDSMSAETLEWLGDFDHVIELESDHVADTLDLVATVLSNEDKSSQPTDSQLSSILWGLSYRSRTISALSHIRSEAGYLAQQRQAAAEAAVKHPTTQRQRRLDTKRT